MIFGVATPVVTTSAGHASWERAAGIDEIVQVAQAADRAGYHFMTCSEHVALPAEGPGGDVYWDPLVTFAHLAALTTDICFLTNVLVIGLHHPLALAKRWGTLDIVSRGRLILGFGVGSSRREFEAMGVPFAERGARADDSLRALRATLGHEEVSYAGSHHAYERMVINPHTTRHVPFWIGGRSRRALRRGLELGEGWIPPPPSAGGPDVAALAEVLASADLPPGFQVIGRPDGPLDPAREPERVLDAVATLAGAGATAMMVKPLHHSLAHYLEQLDAFADLADLAADRKGEEQR